MALTCYVVGGAVRDALLGLPVSDRDWVVVGSTPDEMLAAGFKPVGKDFPVFLHPQTREEYALARTERKTAPGYRGFSVHASPDVTLEEDLQRRDLTINAIARSEDGRLIDPWGGQADLANRVFRHVSAAFAEDPVRILRLARFAARFADFSVAPETLALMREMVEAGEVDHLVAERVWQELARGLMAQQPSRMLAVLAECGALPRLLPELGDRVAAGQRCDAAARAGLDLSQRYALLCLDGADPAAVEALSQRLRAPVEARDLALMLWREARDVDDAREADPAASFFARCERCDAWRRGARFRQMLDALRSLRPALPHALWMRALEAAQAVDAGAIARQCADKSGIPAAVREARLAAMRSVFA